MTLPQANEAVNDSARISDCLATPRLTVIEDAAVPRAVTSGIIQDVDCFQQWNAGSGEPSALFYRVADGYLIRFPAIADFHVSSHGDDVRCSPVADSGERWRSIYQQQVLPLLHSLTGEPVYHGAAVVVDGGAVAFLASSGRGKSTLTAAFAARGMPFLGDDCLHLDWNATKRSEAPVMVRSQPAFVRLWDDSLNEVGPPEVVREHPDWFPKPRLVAGAGFQHCPESMPLRAAFLLSEDASDTISIDGLRGSDALMAWVANAFVLDIKQPETLRRAMTAAGTLARAIPLARLSYPRRYDALPDVVAAVVQHVRSKAGTDQDS